MLMPEGSPSCRSSAAWSELDLGISFGIATSTQQLSIQEHGTCSAEWKKSREDVPGLGINGEAESTLHLQLSQQRSY